ncbi:MAG: hypothetical protein KatS3mg060_2369 [Dehalococcoidia bacterium]|jgi:ketosteroid isomerase-like protein|nr:MAG: hypothetical protein KatS3mg060_2369 [Dehalococcoidia bacterium]
MTTTQTPVIPSDAAALIRRFYDAWQARDAAAMLATLADGDGVAAFGAAKSELAIGRTAIDRETPAWIATCPDWIAMDIRRRVGGQRGGLIWAMDELEARSRDGNDEVSDVFHTAFVLERQAEGLRIVSVLMAPTSEG